ncbi:hypothetical protein B0I72DRAFT_134329 [Yarrowia lipolytica]|uniref:YALI0B19910p n=2 Tax=Yarrowia lipolytica TaxID=4952 RepID=Q6CDZ6_YARLI|nr:YALI0B19910p [Yarrowia lipolytica CLIB122]AOW01957.1 hypothetical protein YALI1_B25997g [Yarrowia lipolytica]KAB8282468.1 hypothetical protein BKA91DRAFT_138437 [Yarrowia lipolytica]KAE8170798.1 hypothetical protein BKA90DRAFT_140136 [Yarrowia lipolytica]KAJ8052731.1 hypothetical protein LXG23DRAFT_38770 [Yarrowia lipolytica]QNP96882.1 Hypothetical protein YALI2_C00535g [Yarrowia lipolytica]|eukprot:XP_501116.1 YALI0B19910p [Yarrowia lipolytica CLIB122]
MSTLEELKVLRKKLSDALKRSQDEAKTQKIKENLAKVYKNMASKVAPTDFTKAIEYSKYVIDLMPTQSPGYLTIGKILQENNKDDAALKMYQIGLKRCPEDDKLRHVLKSQMEVVQRRLDSSFKQEKPTQTTQRTSKSSLTETGSLTEVTPKTCIDPMTTLPAEVVENIFTHVPFRTVVRSMRVSKTWQTTIESMRHVWNSRINFSAAPKDRPVSVKAMERYFKLATKASPTTDLDELKHAKNNIRVINLLGMHSKSQEYAINQWLGAFWFSIERINLSLDGINTIKFASHLKKRAELIPEHRASPSDTITHLKLFSSSTNVDALVRNIITCMPKLISLEVINNHNQKTLNVVTPEPFKAPLPLSHLRVEDNTIPPRLGATFAPNAYKEIASIVEHCSDTLTGLSLSAIPIEYTRPLSKLTHLELATSNHLMEIRYLPNFMAKLQHVKLDNHHTPHFLNSLNKSTSLHQLKSLHLDLLGPLKLGSTLVPSRVHDLFNLSLPSLETLSFTNYMSNIVPGWFELLTDRLPTLVHLDLTNCKLGDIEMNALTKRNKLTNLEFIGLKDTQVTGPSLIALAKRKVGMDVTGLDMRTDTFRWLAYESGVTVKNDQK